jgi:hypothetical protein
VESSICYLSPPNTYSYVQGEKLGSTRQFVGNFSLITCITNLILALHMRSMDGLEEPFKNRGKKFHWPCGTDKTP